MKEGVLHTPCDRMAVALPPAVDAAARVSVRAKLLRASRIRLHECSHRGRIGWGA